MTIDNVNPTIWAGKIQENLNNAHVAVNCCNREYEGEIKGQGDTVKINSIGRVTITAYVKDAFALGNPQVMQDASMMLRIDQANSFNVGIDDIDKAQQNIKLMNMFAEEAAWGYADVVDLYLIALMYAGVASGTPDNLQATRAFGTGESDDDAYEALVDLGILLSLQNVPKGRGARWALVEPEYTGLLLKDPRFVSFGTKENIARLVGGAIGEAAGFTIYESNNIYAALSSAHAVIAGYKGAITYAEQIAETEAYRPQGGFTDALKGLHLFGAKVTRPYALAAQPFTLA